MKRVIFISICVLYGLISAFAQNVQNESSGRIFFFRENNYVGSAVSYNIFVNDSLVVRLKNASFFEYVCDPGHYVIIVNNYQDTRTDLIVEEGDVLYLRFGLNTGFWETKPELILVDPYYGESLINSGRLKMLERNMKSYRVPKSRLGINVNAGIGFERHALFETEDGRESKFSFGGGTAFSLEYGYEFSKHFDLSLDLAYKINQLSPYLQNARWDFTHAIFSITPAYIVSLGESTKLRLGAGTNCSFANSLRIESANIAGGFNDRWKYSTALGFHLNAVFVFYSSDRFSWTFGAKYYNIKYNYNKSEGYSLPITEEFNKGTGDGIDFNFGFHYHF